jgi:EAL domain-containing protein (putative c-di-GMP-specific phosphodiesterase class I)
MAVAAGGPGPRTISVNLSRAQLADSKVVGRVSQALTAAGLRPACLQLEVTESLAAQDEHVRARLSDLKELGLALSLDDFGTGYSSLASLHELPVDVVKIDRSFVSPMETSAHHRVLIAAVVGVARSLGMRTVAEGIETEGQATLLTALGCNNGQGYFYSRPLPAEGATAWLASYESPFVVLK